MKIEDTKRDVGDELNFIKLKKHVDSVGEIIDSDIYPEEYFAYKEKLVVSEVRVTSDGKEQKEEIVSNLKVVETESRLGGVNKTFSPIKEEIVDSEFTFKTFEEAIEERNKRNVYPCYVVKIKGCDNMFYTREFSKLVMLLQEFSSNTKNIENKIIIQMTQKTLDEWINLDITPMNLVVEYASGDRKDKPTSYRSIAMPEDTFEIDLDCVEMDEELSLMRDIEQYTNDRAKEDVKITEEDREDILKDLNVFTKESSEDQELLREPSASPKTENLFRPGRPVDPDGKSKPKPLKRI